MKKINDKHSLIKKQQKHKHLQNDSKLQNRAKINFIDISQRLTSKKSNDLIDSNDRIDPWDSAFNKEEDYKDIFKLRLKQKAIIKRNTDTHFFNKALTTTKSWNSAIQRTKNNRKQLKMVVPKLQAQDSSFFSQEKNMICYYRRKKQQIQPSKQTNQSENILNKFRKMLSQIYSHKVEPQIVIRGYSAPLQASSNISPPKAQISSHHTVIQKPSSRKQHENYQNHYNFRTTKMKSKSKSRQKNKQVFRQQEQQKFKFRSIKFRKRENQSNQKLKII